MNNEADSRPISLTVYHSGGCGNAKNCIYPHVETGSTPEELKQLFRYDHTLIRFKNNYRCIDNFQEAAVVVLDNDNDHSDNPADWVPIEDFQKMIPGISCIIATSRNHNKQKGNKSGRPRYHVLFPVDLITDPKEYSRLTQRIHERFPFFDPKALDPGRFFFGNSDTEVYIFPGSTTIDRFLAEHEDEGAFAALGDTIAEGSRNSTISHAAGKILKRWGDTPEAYEKFMEVVAKCSPPLPDAEVKAIWKSAVKFLHGKLEKQPGYVPPTEYNKPAEPLWEPPIPFTQHTLPTFPVDAFPPAIRDCVLKCLIS